MEHLQVDGNLDAADRKLTQSNEFLLKEILLQSRNFQEGQDSDMNMKKPAPLASSDFVLPQSDMLKESKDEVLELLHKNVNLRRT